ncbi:hypothetical protein ABPG74_015844 [Tetrahymena malaccensis]
MVLVLIDPVWQEFLTKQIEDMNRYKMRMFASLSHELRTPLNCSISMLEFLESDIINISKQATQILTNNIQRQQRLENSQNLVLGTSIQQFQSSQQNFINQNNSVAGNSFYFNQNTLMNSQVDDSHEDSSYSLNNIKHSSQLKNNQNNININNNNGPQTMNLFYNGSSNPNLQNFFQDIKNIQEECERVIQSYLKPALYSSKLLLNLINDILDFVQIDSGKFKFTFIQFSLDKLLHECIVLINLQAKSKNIELCVDFDQSIPQKIESDPNRIRQVLLNFLSNALKFTVQGKITIQAKAVPNSQNLIMLSVIDTGIGISENDIRNIFTIFNKVDLGKNQELNSQGCGLGLTLSNSISKGLAPEQFGGVQVESKVGQGSKFSFIIEDHSSTKLQKKQSCDVLESEEDESNRPNTIQENFRKQFKSPSFSQIFEGGQYITEQSSPLQKQQSSNQFNMIYSDQQSQNNNFNFIQQNLYQQPQFPSNKIQNLNFQQGINMLSNAYDNIAQKGEKDMHMIQQILSENGKCNCIQILAADDNEFNLIVIENILRKYHLNAENSCNGQIAYQKVILTRKQENACCPHYKLIFMDIEMPIMNGYQTSQQIYELYQKDGALEKKPYIVACTAYVGEDDKKLAKLNFMDDFVTKPIQSNILEQVLIRYVSYYLKNNLKNRD